MPLLPDYFIYPKTLRMIPFRLYEKLVADSELDEIKEYRSAKAHKGNAIPFEQAFREIEDTIK